MKSQHYSELFLLSQENQPIVFLEIYDEKTYVEYDLINGFMRNLYYAMLCNYSLVNINHDGCTVNARRLEL